MKFYLWFTGLLLTLINSAALALPCVCEVRFHTPLTASHEIPPHLYYSFEADEFPSVSLKHVNLCREVCKSSFHQKIPAERLQAGVTNYGQFLVEQNLVGHNCTGFTTLKFPIKVRAFLGPYGLGNVVNLSQVINYERICF
jgi:hypothetical protein